MAKACVISFINAFPKEFELMEMFGAYGAEMFVMGSSAAWL